MKKLFTITSLLTLFSLNLFAFEYGANLSTNTDFKFDKNQYNKTMLDQSETLKPYIKVPFNESTYIASEIAITHKFNDILGVDFTAINNLILDLSLLKFNTIIKMKNASSLEISLGRMITSDLTEKIFAQNSDGFFLKYNSQNFLLSGYCGYSGLQNIKTVSMISSGGKTFSVPNENIIYDFAAPYLIGVFSVSAPYLFAKQTVGFEALGAFPIGGPRKLTDDEQNRFYATVSLNGPMASTLFYNTSITIETNNFSQAALLAKFDMKYFGSIKNMTVGFSALYASGKNGALSPFVPLTKQKSCLSATESNYSGILKGGLLFTILPLNQLYLSLGTDVIFNVMEKGDYSGFQAALTTQWQIFSDLKLTFGASTFIGKESTENRTDFVLIATIAF